MLTTIFVSRGICIDALVGELLLQVLRDGLQVQRLQAGLVARGILRQARPSAWLSPPSLRPSGPCAFFWPPSAFRSLLARSPSRPSRPSQPSAAAAWREPRPTWRLPRRACPRPGLLAHRSPPHLRQTRFLPVRFHDVADPRGSALLAHDHELPHRQGRLHRGDAGLLVLLLLLDGLLHHVEAFDDRAHLLTVDADDAAGLALVRAPR